MFKKLGLFALLVTFLSGGVLFSQAPNISEQPAQPGNTTAVNNTAMIAIESFNPQPMSDPRFVVSNFSLDRRYAPDGKGEILDVYFDIYNNTSEAIELYAWVMAYTETNAIDKDERRIVPYPTWRIENPDKRLFLNRYITITPQNIAADQIWTKEDPDYKRHMYAIERMRSTVGSIKPIGDVFPPAWKYVAYINRFPTKGLLLKLYGDQGPAQNELVQTNYVPPTPEEKRTKIFKNVPAHTYTLEHTRRKLIFRSHHYSAYRADFEFFNNVAIVLFDAKKAAEAEEQSKRELREGEMPAQPMVYYRTIRANKKLRIY